MSRIGAALAVQHAPDRRRRCAAASPPASARQRLAAQAEVGGVHVERPHRVLDGTRRPSCSPVVEISSRPSAPWTTHARSEPSISERSRQQLGQFRPRHADDLASRRPGFVSGPSRLNAVRSPSSRRVGAACRIDGWNVGANRNAMPASSRQRSTTAGPARDRHAERLEHVGAAAAARDRAVAVLGHAARRTRP